MEDKLAGLFQMINFGLTGIITVLCVYIVTITILFYAMIKKHHIGVYYGTKENKF